MFQMVGKKSGDSRRATAINRKTKRGNNDDEELPEKKQTGRRRGFSEGESLNFTLQKKRNQK